MQEYYRLIPGIQDKKITMYTVGEIVWKALVLRNQASVPHMRSPELGSGASSWRSTAAALLRFDALPLHCDARKVIDKTRPFRSTG